MRSFSKKPAHPDAMLKRMASLCAKSEQCSFDISTKLYKAGIPKESREEILNYLIDKRFIDDARYARSFAVYKVRFSAWGKRKIRMALAAKRIDSAVITEALDSIVEEDYMEALRRAIKSKKSELVTSDREQRVKLYRHLLSRGFESDLISRNI